MKAVLLDICLVAAVAAVWIGGFAALRLRTALDRLHCVSFVNIAGGSLFAAAAFLDEGLTTRSAKFAALVVLIVAAGAASTHAVGRALLLRDGAAR